MGEVVIVSAVRTPIGSFHGMLAGVPAIQLGATVIRAAVERANLQPHQVQECIMGQVLTAGMGQAPARQAAIGAGLPIDVECMTINKVCGSGLKAVMLAQNAIQLGLADIVVAGGQENMSQAPYILPQVRKGLRLGHGKIVDSMIHDGLWDPYNNLHMGNCAELCVKERNYTREQQDAYAIESYQRAREAQEKELFDYEMVGVSMEQLPNKTIFVRKDEEPQRVKFEKISKLRPAFEKEGTITAANASKLNDGAAALVLMSAENAKKHGCVPLAKIVSQASVAITPKWFTVAPSGAIRKALERANLKITDIDLWEINEAFAVVAMEAMKELRISRDCLNVHGGAIALGHPIGASGARILTTLLYALQTYKLKRGLATLCIGGGEASAVVVERM